MTFRRTKYRNVRTEFNGRIYDSKAEALRASQLDAESRATNTRWTPQPSFALGPDKRYRPDFMVRDYIDVWCEDVKGYTPRTFGRIKTLWNKYGICPLKVLRLKGDRFEVVEIVYPGDK